LRKSYFKTLATAFFFAVSTTAIGVSPASSAEVNQITTGFDWSEINLTSSTTLSQSIKPLNVPPLSSGQVDWSLEVRNNQNDLRASFTLSNTGIAAFDLGHVPAGSRVLGLGSSKCRNTEGFLQPNIYYSVCTAPLTPVAGETYNFSMKPLKINDSQWWEASVRVEGTGEVIQLGRLENNSFQAALGQSSSDKGSNQLSFRKQPFPACSELPNFSAVFGSLKTTTGNQPVLSASRLSLTCSELSSFDNLSSPGFYRMNIGKIGLSQETPKVTPTQAPNNSKPESPKFSLVSFNNNKIDINVDLGSGANKPDQIYLISPKIGATEAKKVFGKISGNIATWSFNLSNLLSGDLVPMKIVSIKNGIESDSIEENFTVPSLSSVTSNKAVPVAPKNITSRVIGTSGIVTTSATAKAGALTRSAYLFGSSLGISPDKALVGEVIGTKVVFEIPIKSSMAGKTYSYTVYFANEVGKSNAVQGKISVPGLPKISTEGITIPDRTAVGKTILCSQGSQTRSFVAKSCPPGWKKT
jgi:hypothetical protein